MGHEESGDPGSLQASDAQIDGLCDAEPDAVRNVLTQYTSIDAATAARIGLPAFPETFNESSLDKLIQYSQEQGLLGGPVTVQQLVGK